MIKLIRFEQGEASCQHCGREIKNLFVIENDGIEMVVGSECVQKLLNTETLPKDFKQAEKEFKNAKFNESIIEMIITVNPRFIKNPLYTTLKNGTRKATDKEVLQKIISGQLYIPTFGTEKYLFNINHKADNNTRVKTETEYKQDIQEYKNNYETYFLSDYADSKECKKFISELIKYAEENNNIWGWTVKHEVTR